MSDTLERPAVLTEKTQHQIVEALAEGNYLSTACLAAGITVPAFNYWRRLYEEGVEHAQKYADFFSAVKKASRTAEISALRTIRTGEDGWQGSAWFLERRFHSRWGRKEAQKKQQNTNAPDWDGAMDRLDERLNSERPEGPEDDA